MSISSFYCPIDMFKYTVDKTLLPAELAEVFVEYAPDKETLDFLDDCRGHPHSKFILLLTFFLSFGLADYEIHGLLKLYPMHLLSSAQWMELIDGPKDTLLDIGAGQGFVTEKAQKTFKKIFATETSSSMLKTLRKKGFVCSAQDLGTKLLPGDAKYDAIAILNVLDRCDFPLTLLKNAASLLKPDGLLLIALPLPLKPYVRTNGSKRVQKQPLPTTNDMTWENQLIFFMNNF